MKRDKNAFISRLELLNDRNTIIIVKYIYTVCNGVILSSHILRLIESLYPGLSKSTYYKKIERLVSSNLIKQYKLTFYNYYVITKTSMREILGKDYSIKLSSSSLVRRFEEAKLIEYILKEKIESYGGDFSKYIDEALVFITTLTTFNGSCARQMEVFSLLSSMVCTKRLSISKSIELQAKSFLYKKGLYFILDEDDNKIKVFITKEFLDKPSSHKLLQKVINHITLVLGNSPILIFVDTYNDDIEFFYSSSITKKLNKLVYLNQSGFVALNLKGDFKNGIPY